MCETGTNFMGLTLFLILSIFLIIDEDKQTINFEPRRNVSHANDTWKPMFSKSLLWDILCLQHWI